LQGLAESQGGTALLDPLAVLTEHGNSSIGAAIAAFSILAIATSFIGTTLGEKLPITLKVLVMHVADWPRLTPR